MKNTIWTFFLVVIFGAALGQTPMPKGESLKKANITYKLLPAPGNSFGYDIYVDGTLTIHQPTIPGMAGNQGFKSQDAAKTVVEMVITKMREGKMPPTVSQEEMKKVKAL